VGIFLF